LWFMDGKVCVREDLGLEIEDRWRCEKKDAAV
jgi:hypothetical protein